MPRMPSDHHQVQQGEHGAPEDNAPQRRFRREIEIKTIDGVTRDDEASEGDLVAEQKSCTIFLCWRAIFST